MSKRESSVRSRDAGSLSSQMAGGSEQVSNISQRIWDSMEPAEQTQKVCLLMFKISYVGG
jgi:hypothetical protein